MKRVTFGVTYPPESAHPVHRGLAREATLSRADLLVWGPTDAVTTLVWYDGGREPVQRVVDGVDSLVEATLVPGDDGTYVFSHQTAFELPDAVLELVARAKLAFLPPVTFLDDRRARFEAVGESRHLSEFHARLSDLVGVRIERVREFERESMPASPAALTERQRAALDAAAAVGYYDVPRTGSVADVADRLDCARSTAGELLRKAESAVVLDALDGDPSA